MIIDFNLNDNNLYSFFGVRKIPKELNEKIKDKNFLSEFKLKEKNIEKLIVNVNRKIDIISNTNLIFDEKYSVNNEKIEEILNDLSEKYDLVLIDTGTSEKYEDIIKTLINLSSKIICIVQGNLIEVKKTKKLLGKYIEEKDKVKFIYNKKSKYSMKKETIKILLHEFKMIGVLHYDNIYNKIINKNINRLYISKKIEREFENIIKKI